MHILRKAIKASRDGKSYGRSSVEKELVYFTEIAYPSNDTVILLLKNGESLVLFKQQ
jgi:hypothetical protein